VSCCVACGGGDGRRFHSGLRRCASCGHAWADLELAPGETVALYGRPYFFGGEYRDYLADQRILEKSFRLRLRVLDRFLDPARHRRLLEVGCAYGFFLDLARGRFEEAVGLDVAEDGVRHAREALGLDAVRGDVLTHDFGARRFDVACLWDTIEHLPRPDMALERIRDLSPSGALLALTTGDLDSLVARLRGGRWRLVHPPTHLHYFTRASLRRVLERHGFDPVYDRRCGFYRSVESAAHGVLVQRWKATRAFEILKRLRLAGLDFYLDLGDIRYLIARRR
jgi:SAM-dependent methyltransferase